MKAKRLTVDSDTIAYYESAGSGPAVLLIHGNFASGRIFQPQLESAVGKNYRLIAIDLPGHGQSSNASHPAATYSIAGYAAIVANIVKQLELESVVIVGWSLGGHIALEIIQILRDAKGVMIFGAPPLSFHPNVLQAFLLSPAIWSAYFLVNLSDAQANRFAKACFSPGSTNIPAFYSQDVRRTDPRASISSLASFWPTRFPNEVEAIKKMTVPLAIIHGEREQLVNRLYLQSLKVPTLWRGMIQIIPGAGHAASWDQPEYFNDLLGRFLHETTER